MQHVSKLPPQLEPMDPRYFRHKDDAGLVARLQSNGPFGSTVQYGRLEADSGRFLPASSAELAHITREVREVALERRGFRHDTALSLRLRERDRAALDRLDRAFQPKE